MEIVIGFSRALKPYQILSKIIMAVEKRDYSHAYIKYQCPITNVMMVCQASHGYVNEMNLDIFLKHNIISHEYTIELTNEEFVDFLTFTKENLGVKYSVKELFLISIKKLFHITINNYDGDESFICSEWAARILKKLKLFNQDKLDYITPSDLDTILKNLQLK